MVSDQRGEDRQGKGEGGGGGEDADVVDADGHLADLAGDAYAAATPDDIAPIDFNILVLSLNTSALIHLGQAGQDTRGPLEPDLPMARQSIDMLGILEEKTRGNLSGEEERLLGQVLFDLRMRYVKQVTP